MSVQIANQDFAARLVAVAEATESTLDALLQPHRLKGERTRPERLLEAMRYGALGGGKRLRPFLLVETAGLFGAQGDGVLRAACALEMVHCYSLIHDDLPAMDDDDLRRGRPTVHKAFDEATAILAGDGLLTFAFDVIADAPTHPDAGVRADLTLMLARAAGLGGMVGGQALDLEAEASKAPHTREFVALMQSMKTGALLLFAVEAGARIGGADAKQTAALSRYGSALGAAFQVADDVLDAEGDEQALGKRAGKDADRNKATLVAALGLEEARRRRDALAEEAIQALADGGFGASAAILAEAARFTVARKS
ncbi:polyprenyl synthetase family protein [Rhodoblastus acidophilus]|uniref:Polyprenyl synthetase family protein n=1 Tax=Candidatus Rhodoblastus alkanivorans TaxID=2954117 RepID=A0ABS9Z3H8_9HYPH|nr:farnesyl diphosphate synthase [Candidatus Rhodoblastus alkanivorans]MCI4678043.1 polyprenyl synthetase family protein [Candidatus Rhodoblastus alkanivorans]MCI4681616.1 polyprenyl synthetase family protein [Candidatus Rhodoblastus alkanivorans]MDI4642664.1 polyprenyl synthetase family protein [Rhodoblastus acidophilus]